MKTVEIEGEKYDIPDWVNWITQDAEGAWYGYETAPVLVPHFGQWLRNEGRMTRVTDNNPQWKESLRKV